jgi:uncharacterized membrane protein YhaH (DUF805 family)
MLRALFLAFFSFRGRLGRSQFAVRVLVLGVAACVAMYLAYLADTRFLIEIHNTEENKAIAGFALVVVAVTLILSLLSLIKRRLADRNRGAIYMILTMVVSAAWITIIETLFFKGTNGLNRFDLPEPVTKLDERIPTIVSTRKLPEGTIS